MYVNVTGIQTSEISQEKIQEIVDEFYQIDYFSLDDVYDLPISDIPHTITSIRINGKYKVFTIGRVHRRNLMNWKIKLMR